MSEEKMNEILEKFDKEFYNKREEIDPDNTFDWFNVALGYFLGAGFDLEDAVAYAMLTYC